MRGLAFFVYGVAAYALGLVALLYFIGFSGNLLVPVSVDVGPTAPTATALAVDLLLLALFGIQHSVMARRGFKQAWTRMVPHVAERSTYVVATAVVLAVFCAFWRPIAAPVLWQVESPAAVAALWSVFAAGWGLMFLSTFLINHFELFGLQQVFARLTGRTPAPMQFRTPLLYRFVRHPLYFGLLLTFWSVPVMTAGRLLFAAGFTLYVLIGIAFEERDLVRQFGDRYRAYQAQVGMLLPWRARSAVAPIASATRGSNTPH